MGGTGVACAWVAVGGTVVGSIEGTTVAVVVGVRVAGSGVAVIVTPSGFCVGVGVGVLDLQLANVNINVARTSSMPARQARRSQDVCVERCFIGFLPPCSDPLST